MKKTETVHYTACRVVAELLPLREPDKTKLRGVQMARPRAEIEGNPASIAHRR